MYKRQVYRDRIRALSEIQAHQDINIRNLGSADVIALHRDGGQTCIQVFFFRAGQNYGNRTYFPSHAKDLAAEVVLGAFLGQFYENKTPPPLILTSHTPRYAKLLTEALAVRAAHRVELTRPVRGTKRKLVDNAAQNACAALGRRMLENSAQRRLLEGTAELLGLDQRPSRIEVYVNSHISGSHALGAMIVSGPEGLVKNAYRKFNIKTVKGIDDFVMMHEVVSRKYKRALDEGTSLPDLILIDGGKGQLSAAKSALDSLGLGYIPIIGLSLIHI